jgi:hypothetical protein
MHCHMNMGIDTWGLESLTNIDPPKEDILAIL